MTAEQAKDYGLLDDVIVARIGFTGRHLLSDVGMR